jgi:uncharacterized YccA/Bax inhibitor family protein
MNSSNPALSPRVFSAAGATTGAPMTLQGAINKTLYFLLFVCLSGYYSWQKAVENPAIAMGLVIGGCIVGLIAAITTSFKPQWAAVTGTVYALAEGLALGAISAAYDARFHGIVLQAVMLTIGVLLAMLALYTTRLVQPTAKFRMGVFAATGGIMLVYVFSWILSLFHIHMFDSLYGNGALGIGFSIFVVIIAAMNLIIDFGVIEYGVQSGAPKFMEWYGAFGLLVTLVWLYLQILRLLSQLASRRN